ncbi:TetR/AcrR family transcriptional regulator [Roseobacter sinensis]|uniref:TetR/AcrR family transcriptional regulator n=1 Tax=Roseobacter sinensis TaxID=2931391 RepID=A0ABT3B909_9RHOB|nr:TetR/AcrR family transcriptional regulator [Roseobacter sp. WL0113]MCV3270064.1 TetR/AcrR family transcriptional regulator [Roseobacter sp. WL0113]
MTKAFPKPPRRIGRPRNFRTDDALEAAMLTFWRNGYAQTSLGDLVRETKASRNSLYKTFGDKRAIFIASLKLYADRFEARAAEAMAGEPDAGAVLHRLLRASALRLSGGEAPAGCLRCNSTLEIGGMDAEIDAALDDANARFTSIMTAVAQRAAEEGTLPTDRVEAVGLFLSATVAGMVLLAKAGADRAALLAVAATAQSAIRQT